MSLKVLCDENIPGAVVASLTERGFIVLRVTPGMLDPAVADLAKRERAVLITFDSDFSNILTYPPHEFYGIMFLAIRPSLAKTVENSLEYIFQQLPTQELYQGKLIVVEPATFRIWGDKESESDV